MNLKRSNLIRLMMIVFSLTVSAPLSYGEEVSPKAPARWAIGPHSGYFGIPDFVLDEIFVEHPSLSGSTIGVEARYYGDKGPDRVFNWLFSLDYGKFSGDG